MLVAFCTVIGIYGIIGMYDVVINDKIQIADDKIQIIAFNSRLIVTCHLYMWRATGKAPPSKIQSGGM